MIPRRVIIDFSYNVKRALLERHFPRSLHLSQAAESIIISINSIKQLGEKFIDLQRTIENLQNDRNSITARFVKSSNEEKVLLKQQVAQIKDKINLLEQDRFLLEKELHDLESNIPNIPGPDVPLWPGYSEVELRYSRTNLEFVHNLINDEDFHKICKG